MQLEAESRGPRVGARWLEQHERAEVEAVSTTSLARSQWRSCPSRVVPAGLVGG
jgi:hypothetical protein